MNQKHNIILKEILSKFKTHRIESVIAYGSSIDIYEKDSQDIDIFVLLKTYQTSDYNIIRKIKSKFKNLSIFIDYISWIKQRGINNYQFGRHGVYFPKILANGICLYGDNYYKKISVAIKSNKIKNDLRYRIDEYFYRIYKEMTSSIDILLVRKYLCRIIIDILLFEGRVSFKQVSLTSYSRLIIEYISKNKDRRNRLFSSVLSIKNSTNTEDVLKLIPEFYNYYTKLYH